MSKVILEMFTSSKYICRCIYFRTQGYYLVDVLGFAIVESIDGTQLKDLIDVDLSICRERMLNP
jgi:hypothetical protein